MIRILIAEFSRSARIARSRRCVVGTLLACAACVSQSSDVETSAAASLPQLEEIQVASLVVTGPESQSASIAVSTDGFVAFTHGYDPDNRVIAIADSLGRIVSRFGIRGDGPGELGRMTMMSFEANNLLVADLSHGQVLGYDTSGKQLFVSPRLGQVIPIRLGSDSSDMVRLLSTANGPRTEIARISMSTGQRRRIVGRRDSAYAPFSRGVPVFASSRSDLIVANPYSFEFQEFTSDGMPTRHWKRDVSARFLDAKFVDRLVSDMARQGMRPAGGREGLLKERQRQFVSMLFDGAGTLWVLGNESGEGFADLFAGDIYLGRVTMPCTVVASALSIGGDFLAALCSAREVNSGVRLRLFRIRRAARE